MNDEKPSPKPDRVRMENVNHPGKSTPVDAGMYKAVREALLAVLPASAPGMTELQMRDAVVPKLPQDLFRGGARAGWWYKAVQLDLEAKGEVKRELSRPLRWHRPAEVLRPSDVRTSRDGGNRPPRHGGDQSP